MYKHTSLKKKRIKTTKSNFDSVFAQKEIGVNVNACSQGLIKEVTINWEWMNCGMPRTLLVFLHPPPFPPLLNALSAARTFLLSSERNRVSLPFTLSVWALWRPSVCFLSLNLPSIHSTHTHTGVAKERIYFWSEVPGSQCSVPPVRINISRLISLPLTHTKMQWTRGEKWLCHRKVGSSSGRVYFYCWIIFRAHLRVSSASTYCPCTLTAAAVLGRRESSLAISLFAFNNLTLWRLAELLKFLDRTIKYFLFYFWRRVISRGSG